MGLSALLVSDKQGNAKASTRGTSDRTAPRFFFCVWQSTFQHCSLESRAHRKAIMVKKTKACGTVANFLKRLEELTKDVNDDIQLFFRAHASLDWELTPPLFRNSNADFRKNECRILKDALIRFPDDFNDDKISLDVLVKAQHYGIPTRMMDITSNPLVALFFACYTKKESAIKGNSIVYVFKVPKDEILYYYDKRVEKIIRQINQNDANEQEKGEVLCVKAKYTNPRIEKQFGAFFLFGNGTNGKNIEALLDSFKIQISDSYMSNILRQLDRCGISEDTLFPEIQSYANKLKNK